MTDVAKVIRDLHERHEGASVSISKTTLKELVKKSLKKKQKEHWSSYRAVIRKLYQTKLKDKEVLLDQAREFARETRYRSALVKAERAVTAKKYDDVHKVLEAARLAEGKHSEGMAATTLPVYLFHRLLNAEFEQEGNYLVETIIPRGGAIMSYGLPKGLKSWFSTAVALDAAIGSGRAAGYFDVPRPVRVLLVQVEDPASRTQNRLKRLSEARPFRQHPYPGDLQVVTRCPLNLLDPNWLRELEAVIAKQNTELVIFDVFRRLFRGNVNSPEDTAAFLQVVDSLRDKYGVAVWIVHHSNKRTEGEMMTRALGSINLTAWADVVLSFKDKQESNGVTRCILEIETKDQAIENELQVVLDDEAEPMLWVEEVRPGEEKLEKAASKLAREWTIPELANAIDLKYAGAYKQLRDWLRAGYVLEISRGSKSHPARYRFASDNPETKRESESS